jgi:hypothetical protein
VRADFCLRILPIAKSLASKIGRDLGLLRTPVSRMGRLQEAFLRHNNFSRVAQASDQAGKHVQVPFTRHHLNDGALLLSMQR